MRLDRIHLVNEKAERDRPANLDLRNGLYRNTVGAVGIHKEATDLQRRPCVIVHTGPSGHGGVSSTNSTIGVQFAWYKMSVDIHGLVTSSIHCISTSGGGKVPRPFGGSVHGKKPNDFLQFVYMKIRPSRKSYNYALMLRDDHTD